jgi:hypothetical protein
MALMSDVHSSRLRQLQITLEQIQLTLPESDGILRHQLECLQRDVEHEIAKLTGNSQISPAIRTWKSNAA